MQGKFPVHKIDIWDFKKETMKTKKIFKKTVKGQPTALGKVIGNMAIGTVFTGEFDPDNYHNLVRIEDIEAPSGGGGEQSQPSTGGSSQSKPSPQKSGGGGGGYTSAKAGQFRDPDEISRTECLKESVAIESEYLKREGMHKKTVKPDVVDGNILARAEMFYQFVKGELKVGDPTSTSKDLDKNPADLDQPSTDEDYED